MTSAETRTKRRWQRMPGIFKITFILWDNAEEVLMTDKANLGLFCLQKVLISASEIDPSWKKLEKNAFKSQEMKMITHSNNLYCMLQIQMLCVRLKTRPTKPVIFTKSDSFLKYIFLLSSRKHMVTMKTTTNSHKCSLQRKETAKVLQWTVPVVFCAACGRNAAAKFALSRNAFRKIWQFLIRNFKSGFESKIILY